MARCGRCGLWSPYPANYKEQKYAGVCLWFQHRLIEDEIFEKRDCREFFERVPDLTPLQHFEYRIKRDAIGRNYRAARRAIIVAVISIILSMAGLGWKILEAGFGG